MDPITAPRRLIDKETVWSSYGSLYKAFREQLRTRGYIECTIQCGRPIPGQAGSTENGKLPTYRHRIRISPRLRVSHPDHNDTHDVLQSLSGVHVITCTNLAQLLSTVPPERLWTTHSLPWWAEVLHELAITRKNIRKKWRETRCKCRLYECWHSRCADVSRRILPLIPDIKEVTYVSKEMKRESNDPIPIAEWSGWGAMTLYVPDGFEAVESGLLTPRHQDHRDLIQSLYNDIGVGILAKGYCFQESEPKLRPLLVARNPRGWYVVDKRNRPQG